MMVLAAISVADAASLAVAVLAILAALAAAASIFRVNYMKATIETQKETIVAQEQRLDQYKDDQQTQAQAFTELSKQLQLVRNENASLRGIVTGRQAIDDLTAMVTDRSQHLDLVLGRIEVQIKNLLEMQGARRAEDQ